MSTRLGIVLAALALVLGVPFVFGLTRGDSTALSSNGRRVVIVTPHNEQIRFEFEAAFQRWHEATYDEAVQITWVRPGGTSEIRNQLRSMYADAISSGLLAPSGQVARPDKHMAYDLLFGGGSYEHDLLKHGVSATPPGADEPITLAITSPADLSQEELDAIYGLNFTGLPSRYDPERHQTTSFRLYDPEQYWLGSALSGFGIVFNRDVIAHLNERLDPADHLREPSSWHDLADPRYVGWVGLADPRQSGSVTTTYESILNWAGWDEGWRILRDMSANARYFANNSAKVPIEVSQGDVAIGVAIDFYGRYQSQAVMPRGATDPRDSRVGYIDPPGAVYVDADPISLLRGGPDPELARRLVRFVLSEQGQALWQLEGDASVNGAHGDEIAGPRAFELRRMPIRRDMYDQKDSNSGYRDAWVDEHINPFASNGTAPSRGWRSSIPMMMACFSIDIHDEHVAAWRALNALRAAVAKDRAAPELLAQAEAAYYAMPEHTFPLDHDDEALRGRALVFNADNYRAIRNVWRDPTEAVRSRMAYARFFREQYAKVVDLAAGVTE